MANIFDVVNCSQSDFLKYLEESNPKEHTFKSMWEKLNVKYIEISSELFKLNEKRHELLEKVRSSQNEYKRLFGLGEIKPIIDANEDEEIENSNIQEPKTSDKKGRKKNTQTEDLENVDEDELENVPKMKTKEPKKSGKQTKTVKEPEPNEVHEDGNDQGDGEPPEDYVPEKIVPVVTKKSTKKSSVKKVEPEETAEETAEETPVVKSGKTSKTSKTVDKAVGKKGK